jgi:hypothetical protein
MSFQPRFFAATSTEPFGGYPGVFGWVAWLATALSVVVTRQWRSREMFYAVTTLFVLGVIYAWPVIGDSFHLMMPIAAHARARMLFTLLCAIQTAAAIDLVRRVPMLLSVLAAAIMLVVLLQMPMASALDMFPGMLTLLAATVFALTRTERRRPAPADVAASRAATPRPQKAALHRETAAAMALLIIVIAELFHAGRDRNMPLPERTLYPKTPLIAKLQELVRTSHEPFRFVGMYAQFFPNLSGVYGIEDIRAHDPMSNARYLAFLKLTADYEPWNYFAFLKDPDKSVYDFLNVRYVVLESGMAATDPARYAVIYEGRDGKILENRTVLPRFYSVRSVLPVFYPHMRQHRDWANTAFADDANFGGAATTKITSASATEYRLRASAAQRSLVVSSMPFWPGWNVSINGKRVKPMKVNAVFLGFAVPPGESDVRVWYSPMSFWIGVWVSLGTLVALVVARLSSRA